MSIVCDLKQLEASVFDDYLQRGRSGINGILNKFFQSMDRCDNDLSRSNFVDHILIQSLIMIIKSDLGNIFCRLP